MLKPIKTRKGVNLPEKERRVFETLTLLSQFHPPGEISKMLMDKYQIKRCAAQRYITQARELWELYKYKDVEAARARALNTLEQLYLIAFKEGKLETCLKIHQEINKVAQLIPKELDTSMRDTRTIVKLVKNQE